MFFINYTATTEIYTLSLHDALPICAAPRPGGTRPGAVRRRRAVEPGAAARPRFTGRAAVLVLVLAGLMVSYASSDRKSTRLNSSHANISYAVFCLEKKKQQSSCYKH